MRIEKPPILNMESGRIGRTNQPFALHPIYKTQRKDYLAGTEIPHSRHKRTLLTRRVDSGKLFNPVWDELRNRHKECRPVKSTLNQYEYNSPFQPKCFQLFCIIQRLFKWGIGLAITEQGSTNARVKSRFFRI